jgi:hypothetical protein
MARFNYLALAGLAALACDGGLQPANDRCPSGICGTITITGTAPDSTDGVFVLAYATFPDLQRHPGFPAVPASGDNWGATAAYTSRSPTGVQWIVAAWKKVRSHSAADTILREAGYRNPPTASPGP